MRVLTFVHSFDLGGVERVALRLVRRWRELGTDAPLFVGRVAGDMRADVGGDLDFITPSSPGIGTGSWETLWMIVTLPRVVRRLRPDILFCAGNSYTVVAVALKLILGRDCPPIVAKISNSLDRRDIPGWWRWAYRRWLRIQGRFLDHVVGMDDAMSGEIRDALGLSADQLAIIPDPALSEAMIARLRAQPQAVRLPQAGIRFVAVGRLASQKNFALMLRAFRTGAREHDRLVIIGNGPARDRLVALAAELGLSERVEFRGYVPEPSALLSQFDICLLSSDYEGVPAAVLEALAARLPVIATDCSCSMAGLLAHGALGRLVAVGDEQALVAAIAGAETLHPNDDLSLAQARRFTIELAGEAYLRAMRQVLAHERSDETDALLPAPPHSIGKICA
ncbi:glycosyltransferase [Novosphingobium sp. G106]|uniref:glycosyltransferase n=1 Tax=Novosphingobium sp. G106 TaxID=2849500 RepID=UPI001C2DB87C|nr:glycosyltransferase [Novosphingobium sp. G106]MBV1692618.1 glycosyltransferase [Novosphingobium sp. G106]